MRKHWFLLAGLAGAAALLAPSRADEGGDAKIAQLFQSRCASCHFVPDPDLATDLAWLDQVNRTSWTSTPKGARAALIAWLKSDDRTRPARAQAEPGETDAAVTCDIEGSIVLKGPAGDVALVWGPGEKGQARAVPAGKYAVRTARVVRDGWFLSSTGMPNEFRPLRAGETKKLDVPDTVLFHGMVKRKGPRLQLGFGIRSGDGRGLSVYRDGKRVPVTWKLLSRKGKVLAEGRMNYGWGGGGWASVKAHPQAQRVEYEIETGPFELKGRKIATLTD